MTVIDEIMVITDVSALESIGRLARERANNLREAEGHSLKVGDRVRTRNLKPKYLSGECGEIVLKNNDRIRVKFDRPIPKAYKYLDRDNSVSVPVGCVERA